MASLSYDRLNSLEKSRSDWKIKVRVTRMWPTVAPDNGTTKGFNLILLDDDNTHVHAFAYADIWQRIGKDVVEGGVFFVENFSVRDSIGNLKPVSSKISIRLMHGTTFQATDDDNMIPSHKFEFLDLGDLSKEASRFQPNEIPDYAIDVIGVVEEYENCRRIGTRFGERDIVRFRLCDGSNRHRASIWGELANKVQEDYYANLEKPVIAVITSTKLTTYINSVQISSLPSSKVYFNLKDDSVMEMRQRLEEEGYGSLNPDDDMSPALPIVPPYEMISLKELTIDPFEKIKKKLFCTFTIVKLEEGMDWYLNACSICQKELLKIEQIFNCRSCLRNMPVSEKRFRIKVIAEDATMSCSVFVMDRVVKQIVGMSASMLIKAHKDNNNSDEIPTVLTTLVGKEVCVIIDVVQGIEEDEFVLNAVDIYDANRANASISETATPPNFPTINLSDSFNESEVIKTPGSATSVSKKVKVEK